MSEKVVSSDKNIKKNIVRKGQNGQYETCQKQQKLIIIKTLSKVK